MNSEIEPALSIELESFADLIRFAASNIRGGHTAKIFTWKEMEKDYYATFATFQGYYEYRALPIWFFVGLASTEEHSQGSFISYDLKTGEIESINTLKDIDLNQLGRELIRLVPIIRLKKRPKIFSGDTTSK